MAVRIRLARRGAKKRPFYRLVAADSEAPRDGKFLEILGFYDPTKEPAKVNLHREKVSYWLEKGATVTGSARDILKREGLL
jgi:small subunit ribosomal protein S16